MEKGITILRELEDYIPTMDSLQRNELKNSIIKEGLRDAIIIWERDSDLVIVDGHNRYRILEELNELKQVKFTKKKFRNIDEAKEWMLILQLGRRNLTANQISVLRGTLYSIRKLETKNNRFTQKNKSEKTVERMAREYGVSSATISNDLNFVKGIELLNEQLKKNILNHTIKVNKSDIEKLGKKNLDEIGHLLIDGKINSVSQLEKFLEGPKTVQRKIVKDKEGNNVTFHLDEYEFKLLEKWHSEISGDNLLDVNEVAKSIIINRLYELKSLTKL